MGITTKRLGELLEKIDDERLQLPEIQREFVWSKNSVKLLFDSLYRELPIGQMLVWKPKGTVPHPKSFKHKKHRRSPATIDAFYGYLLDGQQRLTALARVSEADDDYPLMIDLNPEHESAKTPFFWGRTLSDSNPWEMPVTDVLGAEFNITAHLKRLEKENHIDAKQAELVRRKLTNLQAILNYDVSVVEYESDDYKEATELFIRFNSTGKKLNKNDLALADLATRIEGLTSDEMGKVLEKWKPHFQFTRPFLIQCLAAVHTGRMNLKSPKDVWKDSTPGEIKESWKKTESGLGHVISFLTGTVHWDSGTWIPSFNALIPLIYIAAQNGRSFNASERALARRWLLLSCVHSYFSGAVYTQLDQVLRKLNDEPTVESLWNNTRKKLGKIKKDDFAVMRRSGPAMSLFISMLRENNARDWITGDRLDGTVLGKNAKLHVHHFFPRALLSKHGEHLTWINTFANYTILTAGTNFDVSMEEPATYSPRLRIRKNELKAQCIPDDPSLWHVKRYEDFIRKRERLLAKKANEFLGLA